MVNSRGEDLDVDLRVDVLGHAGHDVHFRLAQRAHHRARLAVEIDDVKGVEIGDMKFGNAQPRECEQVEAPHPAAACNGDPLVA